MTASTAPTTTKDLRNTDLLALAAQGDNRAWAEIVARYPDPTPVAARSGVGGGR